MKKNLELESIKPSFTGNLLSNGKFSNGDMGDIDNNILKILKWGFSKNPQAEEKSKDSYKLRVINNNTFYKSQDDLIIWLGHASFYIRINGKGILIDPVFVDKFYLKRKTSFACPPENIRNVDYILLSHGHRDHFDMPSLETVLGSNPKAIALLPLGMGDLYRSIEYAGAYQEAAWYQKYKTDGVEIFFLPAKHWNKRFLFDFNTYLWGSFLIKYRNKTIYFAGDTSYNKHFTEIKNAVGKIDICLLPIGAYKPDYVMKESHLTPEEAVKAFADLEGAIMIPMHYGTYDLSDEPLGEPYSWINDLNRRGLINGKLKTLAIGEEFVF